MDSISELRRLAGITEAGPSRLVKHIQENRPFVVISPEREYNSDAENRHEMFKMKSMLSNLPVGYIEQYGEWEGIPEQSLFITPRKKLPEYAIDNFKKSGVTLMKAFDQDAFIFSNGHSIVFINRDGSVDDYGLDAVTFSKDKIKDSGGYSSIKDQPYVFSSPDHKDSNSVSQSIKRTGT